MSGLASRMGVASPAGYARLHQAVVTVELGDGTIRDQTTTLKVRF